MEFSSRGQNASGTATATPSSGAPMHGTVRGGGGITGRQIRFQIDWDSGSLGVYDGMVGDDDFAHGTTYDAAHSESRANWDSTVPLGCLSAPAQAPAPQQQAPKSATVTSDVDVYDAPGGNGNIIGILPGGKQVQLVGTCNKDDWCNVSGPAVPTGKGWGWGALNF